MNFLILEMDGPSFSKAWSLFFKNKLNIYLVSHFSADDKSRINYKFQWTHYESLPRKTSFTE